MTITYLFLLLIQLYIWKVATQELVANKDQETRSVALDPKLESD